MRLSPSATSRKIVILAFVVSALAVGLDSGAPVNAHPGSTQHPSSSSCVGGPKYCWLVQTVDYNSNDYNYVTGIENAYNIVGAYSGNNNAFSSFYASPNVEPPGVYPSPFTPETYKPYPSTFLEGLSNGGQLETSFQVGYATALCPSCKSVGVILQGGSWTTVQNPSAGYCGSTRILAMNETQQGVGYYLKPTTTKSSKTCEPQAFEFYPDPSGGYDYHDFSPSPPPGSAGQPVISSIASGINTLGDVVGTVTYGTAPSLEHEAVWFYSDMKYYAFQNGTYNTSGNGIEYDDGIVGDYALRPYVRQRVKLGSSAVGCSSCAASNSAGGT